MLFGTLHSWQTVSFLGAHFFKKPEFLGGDLKKMGEPFLLYGPRPVDMIWLYFVFQWMHCVMLLVDFWWNSIFFLGRQFPFKNQKLFRYSRGFSSPGSFFPYNAFPVWMCVPTYKYYGLWRDIALICIQIGVLLIKHWVSSENGRTYIFEL